VAKTARTSDSFSILCRPESIGPPVTTMDGRSSRAAAMSIPGVILSQLVSSTMPSSWWACMMLSTMSAMSSREGSEKRMPLWPIEMPSQIPATWNFMATPPAAWMPFSMARSRRGRWIWPGIRSVLLDASPISGFPISSRLMPQP